MRIFVCGLVGVFLVLLVVGVVMSQDVTKIDDLKELQYIRDECVLNIANRQMEQRWIQTRFAQLNDQLQIWRIRLEAVDARIKELGGSVSPGQENPQEGAPASPGQKD